MARSAQSPADVIEHFSAALHDGRVEDALALYEPDAVFVAQPGAPVVTGRENIRDALQNLASLRPLSGSAPDGTPVNMSGTSADVMRHRPDGTWGILIDDPWAMPAPQGASVAVPHAAVVRKLFGDIALPGRHVRTQKCVSTKFLACSRAPGAA